MLDLLIGIIINFLDTRYYPLKNEIKKDQEIFYQAVFLMYFYLGMRFIYDGFNVYKSNILHKRTFES